MFNNQKKFEQELNRLRAETTEGVFVPQASGSPTLLRKVVADLLIKTGIAKVTASGEIEYNERGYPKIDWGKAIFGIWKIIAYLVALTKIEPRPLAKKQ